MITEGSTWFVIATWMLIFTLGMITMWVVAAWEIRKIRRQMSSVQYQADRASHWQRLAEIEAERVASLKTEVRLHRSKREAAEAENQRLRRRWDDGVLFMKHRTVHHAFLESHINPEQAMADVVESLLEEITADLRSRATITRHDVLDQMVQFRVIVPAKPFLDAPFIQGEDHG